MKRFAKIFIASIYWLYSKIKRRKNIYLILYYHGVFDKEVAQFTMQMEYLAKKHYVVSLRDLLNKHFNTNKTVVAITFDDAFENVFINAIPVLKKYNFPASIFVPAGQIGKYPDWDIPDDHPDKKQRIMTEEQIQFLDREGFDIYSHTLNHSRLTQCNSKTIKNELELSKLTLERILGHAVNYISYPHGEYDSCTLEYTAKAGYTKGFTITPCNVENCNRQNNNLEIPRFRVTPDTGCFIFSLICSGSFGIIGKINCVKRNFSTKVARFFQAYV